MNQRLRFLKVTSVLFLLLIVSVTSIAYAHPDISQQAVVSSWSTKDIGAVSRKGGLVSSGNILKVKGSGRDIGGRNDQFCYVYTSLSGDGQLVAHLISQDATDNAAKAGLMLRETLADNAANVFLRLTPRFGIAFQWRGASGAMTQSISGSHGKVPLWMKLMRQNNIVTGWTSYDGLQWMEVTSVAIKMPATVSIGLAVTSHNETRLSQAAFIQVILSKRPILPTPVPPTPRPTPAPVSDNATRVYGQGGNFFTSSVNINALSLYAANGVVIDSSGNLYIADAGNNRVLYYPAGSTTATRVYGQKGSFSTNGGILSANSLNAPNGVVIDSSGNLYIADAGNNRVLYYPAGSTTATRVYGQAGSFTSNDSTVSVSGLNTPGGITLDSSGNLYVTDTINNRVLYYPAGSTTATRVYGQAGSFTSNANSVSASGLNDPEEVSLDSNGNLYVVDNGNNRVLYYPAGSTTAIRVYGQAGSFSTSEVNKGGISVTSLNAPNGIVLDSNDNLYIADSGNNRVLYYPVGSMMATRVYGQAGSFTTNKVNNGGVGTHSLEAPNGIALDSSRNLYIADSGNNRVLYYPAGSITAMRVYGQNDSFYTNSFNVSINSLNAPFGVAVDSSGNLYVADARNNRVLYYPAGSTTPTRVYGQKSFATNTENNGGISASSLNIPDGIALDNSGNLYIADNGNNRVLYYPVGSMIATRVYGQGNFSTNGDNNGVVSATSLNSPTGVLLDRSGNLYIADGVNNRVLYYPAGSTEATRVYGQAGSFTTNDHNHGGVSASSLNYLNGGMVLDSSGNLYIADSANSRVLYYPAGSITATRVYGQAGSFSTREVNTGGVSATNFMYPSGIALDSSGNLYIADIFNNRVLYYPSGSTAATRVYGQQGSFTTSVVNTGGVSASSLNTPLGVALDKDGNLYVADATNNRVLMFPYSR